jgi:hypothetical protein
MTSTAAQPATSIASSGARSQPTFRFKRRRRVAGRNVLPKVIDRGHRMVGSQRSKLCAPAKDRSRLGNSGLRCCICSQPVMCYVQVFGCRRGRSSRALRQCRRVDTFTDRLPDEASSFSSLVMPGSGPILALAHSTSTIISTSMPTKLNRETRRRQPAPSARNRPAAAENTAKKQPRSPAGCRPPSTT